MTTGMQERGYTAVGGPIPTDPRVVDQLERVLAWLTTGGDDHRRDHPLIFNFNMSFFQTPSNEPGCATTACIAGAVNTFNGIFYDSGDWDAHIRAARDALQLERAVAQELFMMNRFTEQYKSMVNPRFSMRDVGASDAAKVVRHFLKTGIVDWTVAFPVTYPEPALPKNT